MNDITPQNIPTMSLTDKTEEYKNLAEGISDQEAVVAKNEFELKRFLTENGFENLVIGGGKLTDLRDSIKVLKPEEVDQEKTDQLRKDYLDKVKTYVDSKIDLEKQRSKLTDVKNYIVFLREILQLSGQKQKGDKGEQPKQQ